MRIGIGCLSWFHCSIDDVAQPIDQPSLVHRLASSSGPCQHLRILQMATEPYSAAWGSKSTKASSPLHHHHWGLFFSCKVKMKFQCSTRSIPSPLMPKNGQWDLVLVTNCKQYFFFRKMHPGWSHVHLIIIVELEVSVSVSSLTKIWIWDWKLKLPPPMLCCETYVLWNILTARS
jgi:hypothetical protein